MPFIERQDLKMYYEVYGQGEDLILIAGLGVDHSLFKTAVKEFAKSYRVIVFDNRGVGLTDKPKSAYTIELMTQDTLQLMDALHLRRCHLLGVSLGGKIALTLASEYPERVKSLILVATANQIKKPLSGGAKLLKQAKARLSSTAQPYYAFKNQMSAAREDDARPKLQAIQAPTLILQGTKDRSISREQALELHKGIKGSKLIFLNGGHLFFLFNPQKFSQLVLDFLSSL